MRARWVPVTRTFPPSTRTTSSTTSSTSGLAVTSTVVRPRRASASRDAMRASVWASTALVGSTSTSTSASVSSARARATRCRCPPDSERPFSGRSPSSPPGTESRTSPASATCIACSSSARDARSRTSSSSASRPVNRCGVDSATTTRSRTSARRSSAQQGPAPAHAPQPLGQHRVAAEPSEARGDPGRLVRVLRHQRDESAGAHDEPALVVDERLATVCGRGVDRVPGRRGRDAQHLEHLAGADDGAGGDPQRFGGGPQGLGEECGEPVERDELARRDVPGEREPGAVPDHGGQEEAGQQRLERVEQRLGLGDADAGAPHDLGLLPVPTGEHLLAADAAQDPQPGHRVGAEGGEPAGRLALLGLAASRSGLTSTDRIPMTTGSPTRTSAPSTTDVFMRTTAIVAYAAIPPRNRGAIAYSSPVRSASFATVATTSPVGSSAVTASPVRVTCRPMSWDDTNADRIQFSTSSRCPTTFASTCTSPTPRSAAHPVSRADETPSSRPPSTIRPITYGSSAPAMLPSTPTTMAATSTPACWRPIHTRNARGERSGGVPGSARGRGRTRGHARRRHRHGTNPFRRPGRRRPGTGEP